MRTNRVGKTSLLNAFSDTDPRSVGRCWLGGEEISSRLAPCLARRGIGYVFQGRDIFPPLTARANLETGLACLAESA